MSVSTMPAGRRPWPAALIPIGIAVVALAGLILLPRLGRIGDDQTVAPASAGATGASGYPARIARWRKAGGIVMILGAVTLVASLVGLIVLSVTMAQHLAPGATAAPQPQPQQMLAGTIATGGLVLGIMALVLGWLLRQKR